MVLICNIFIVFAVELEQNESFTKIARFGECRQKVTSAQSCRGLVLRLPHQCPKSVSVYLYKFILIYTIHIYIYILYIYCIYIYLSIYLSIYIYIYIYIYMYTVQYLGYSNML